MKIVNVWLVVSMMMWLLSGLSAQNCSVNAGVSGKFCAGQVIKLDGATSGTLGAGQSVTWILLSGPGGVSIPNPNKVVTTATATAPGSYTFKLSVTCGQGSASQNVTHEVLVGATPDAGPDQTLACYDGTLGLTLTGYNAPPAGYTAHWNVSTGYGSVEAGVFRPNSSTPGYCGPTGGVFVLTYTMTNGKGCSYTDTKTVTVTEIVPPLELAFSGGCGKPSKVEATCKGSGTGVWSFVSPVGGGGATFKNPDQISTELLNLQPSTTYTVRFSFSGSCSDQTKDLTFTTPANDKGVSNATCPNLDKKFKNVSYSSEAGYTGVATLFFCGAPDTILLEGSVANIGDDEVSVWKLDNAGCDFWAGTPEGYPTMTQINDHAIIITDLTNGVYILEYQITCSAGCLTKYKVKIEIEAPGQKFTYRMSNDCADPNYTRYNLGCRGNNESVIWGDTHIHFAIPPTVVPILAGSTQYILQEGLYTPISAPPGGETLKAVGDMCGNFSEHWFEYYINMDKAAPAGTYIFNIPIVYGNNESPCGESFATIIIDLTQPPTDANAGTDQYFCGTSGQIIGNTVSTPEWRLAKKLPANAADPALSNVNNKQLDITGMTANAEYYFVYFSHGGGSCGSRYDTVKVGTSDSPPPQPSAGADATMCFGTAYQLAATPAQTPYGSLGTWSLVSQVPAGMPPTFSDINNPAALLTNLLPSTVYTLRYTLFNKCGEKTDDVFISTGSTEGPAPAFAGANMCLPLGKTKAALSALAPYPTGATGAWTSLPSNPAGATIVTASNNKTDVTGLAAGTYRFLWTISKPPCAATTDTVTITIGAEAEVLTEDVVLCNQVLPTVINLSATPASGGQWVLVSGTAGQPTNPTAASTQVTNVAAGFYIYRWQVNNGACSSYKDVSIKVGGITPPATAGADATLCNSTNGIYTLNGNAAAGITGLWTVEDVAPNVPSAGASFVNGTKITDAQAQIKLTPGTTRLRWTLLPGGLCNEQPSQDEVVINYVPKASFVEDTVKVCDGTLVNIAGVFPGQTGSGIWTQLSGPSAQYLPKIQDTENPLIIKLNGGIGTYSFIYTINSALCPTSKDTLTVINSPLPAWPDLGPGETFCVKDAIFLKGSALLAGYDALWTYKKGPTPTNQATFTPNAKTQNVQFSPVQTGIYEFNYTISNGGCSVDAFVTHNVTLSTINAGTDKVVCGSGAVTLAASGAGQQWIAEAGNPSPATVNPSTGVINGISADGDYFFRLEETTGTRCSDIVKVSKKASPAFSTEPLPTYLACLGATLSIDPAGSGPGVLSYQWQQSTTAIGPWTNTGSNALTFAPPSGTTGDKYYKLILKSDNGCNDTSAVAKVTIKQQITISTQPTDLTICEGSPVTLSSAATNGVDPLSYKWQNSANAAGPWTDVAGATTTMLNSSIPAGSTKYYQLVVESAGLGCNDVTTTAAKVVSNLKTKIGLADSTNTCNASGNGEVTVIDFSTLVTIGDPNSVTWQSLDITAPPGPWTAKDFTGSVPGLYRFVVTTTNALAPCPNVSDTILVRIKSCCPLVCTNPPAEPLCNLSSSPYDLTTLLCAGNQAGTWSIQSGPGITNPVPLPGANFVSQGAQPGIYTLSYTINNAIVGCPQSSTESLNVIQQTNAGIPASLLSICSAKDSILNLTELLTGEDVTGYWQDNGQLGGNLDTQTGKIDLASIASGNYQIKYIVQGSGACPSDTSTVEISLKPTPQAQAGIDQEIACKTPEVSIGSILNGMLPGTEIVWTAINGQQIADPGLPTQTINQPGTYIVKVLNLQNGCFDEDTVFIGKGSNFIEDVISRAFDAKCFDTNTGSISVDQIVGGNPPFTYYLSGEINESNNSGIFKNLASGNYTIRIEDSEGCLSVRDFVLEPPHQPSLYLKGDTIVYCGDTISLQIQTDISNISIADISWFSGKTLIDTSGTFIKVVSPTSSTSYSVRIKDLNGCEIETRINIKVDNGVAYFAPNVFTPNFDGINDEFKVYFNKEVDKVLAFRVFDRWGALMVEQKDMDPKNTSFGWDGSYRSQAMNPGVYVWMAEYKDCKGNIVLIKGDVTLIN